MRAPELSEETLATGVVALSARDRDLAAVVARFGPPPLWARDPGFGTLIQIILEQQVSLASARAAYLRLLAVIGEPLPERVLVLTDDQLKRVGFSRQKAAYVRALAQAIVSGAFEIGALDSLDDERARSALLTLKGIGGWSADIYLLMALRRADVWPGGDLALAIAVREVKRLRKVPGPERLATISRAWRPWRAVAARVLWHHYLSTPRTRGGARRSA